MYSVSLKLDVVSKLGLKIIESKKNVKTKIEALKIWKKWAQTPVWKTSK
jgi:hypothetical protein